MGIKFGLRLAFLAVCAFNIGCAEDAGREWASLSEADTSLIFTAPGLDALTRRLMPSEALDYSHTTEIGVWSSPVSTIPKALMTLHILSPGRVYSRGLDIERYIRSLKFLDNKSPSFGVEKFTNSKFGKITYRVFSFDDLECMAFGHNFGKVSIDESVRALIGANMLIGFYCGDPGKKLSPNVIALVGQSIGVKGAGSP